jgi:hypothetical protein
MSTLQMPTAEHAEFDEICAPVDDFEPLPTVVAAPEQDEPKQPVEEVVPLDGLILAGLVTPY